MRKTLQQTLAFPPTVCFVEIHLSSVGNIRGSVIGIDIFFGGWWATFCMTRKFKHIWPKSQAKIQYSTVYILNLLWLLQILGLRRGKQKGKEIAEKSTDERTKVSLTQPDQHSTSEDTLNHEFYQEEKGDSNGLISSQDLITEEPFNEGTLREDELSDSDSQVLNEGKT